MKIQEKTNHNNSFLQSWIHGQLTTQELYDFTNSDNYKNLVQSKIFKS